MHLFRRVTVIFVSLFPSFFHEIFRVYLGNFFKCTNLFMMKWASRFLRISMIFSIAFMAFFHKSLSYLTGQFRRFSNSNTGSTMSSLPWVFRQALVQRSLRGFFLRLNIRWHFERQNLKIYHRCIRIINRTERHKGKEILTFRTITNNECLVQNTLH